jgi:UDP-N-acetylglucosamine 3-dehydrogenase
MTEARPVSLRGAIVGFGFIASRGHLPGYSECRRRGLDVQISAVADVCEPRRRLAQDVLPSAKIYNDYRALLDHHAHELDFVDITTPPALHAEIARHALERGLHVLCEKPLTTGVEEALVLTRVATRAKRVLFPCHNYRHAPVVQAVRRILRGGTIGEVRSVTQQTFRTTHAKGVAEWQPDWRRDPALAGGGILMDHGSHTFYLAFEWLGGYPVGVSARAYSLDGLSTEDNVSCSVRFPNGVAHATLSWTAGTRKVLYTIHGKNGAIIVDDDIVRVLMRQPADSLPPDLAGSSGAVVAESHWDDASHRAWFADLFADFRRAIDRNDWVSRDTLDAVQCVATISACYASSRESGREIRMSVPSGVIDGSTASQQFTAA